jgi:hypothetical protein
MDTLHKGDDDDVDDDDDDDNNNNINTMHTIGIVFIYNNLLHVSAV